MKTKRLIHLTSLAACSGFTESTFLFFGDAPPAAFVSTRPRRLSKPRTKTNDIGPHTTISSPSPLLSTSRLKMKTVLTSDTLDHDTNQEENEDPWSPTNLQLCARQWDLTPHETTSLERLGKRLADIPVTADSTSNATPFQVIRFLKEFNSDESLAEQKFRAMRDWRRNKKVDEMISVDESSSSSSSYRPPSLYRYFPAGVLRGVDNEGDPIHLERTGAADSSGLLNRYGRQEMIQQSIWLREVQTHGKWHKTYEAEQGHPVKQFSVIMDMKGLSMKNIGPSLLSVAQEVSRIVQDNYPGYAKRIFIIRAPSIFRIAYNAMKPFIDPSMIDKVVMAGDKDYCKVLEQYMDLEVLPPEVYPQGRGEAVEDFHSVVWQGGKLPKHGEVVEPPQQEAQITTMAMMKESTEEETQEATITEKDTDRIPNMVIDTALATATATATTTAGADDKKEYHDPDHPTTSERSNSLRIGRRRLGHFAIVQTKRLKDGLASVVWTSNHDHPYAI